MKWDFKNSRHLGKIEGKLYTLKQMAMDLDGGSFRLGILIEKIEEIEKLVKQIEL